MSAAPRDTTPAHLDLSRLFVDVDSCLGRAAAAGLAAGRLPERFPDVLMAYLRARALAFAQRHRTGIALGRQALRHGVERVWTCVDLALAADAGTDVEAAVERLVDGDLGALYDRGYELAFERLEHMASESRLLLQDERCLAVLGDLGPRLRRWASTTPESWTAPDEETGEPVDVDPVAEFDAFLVILGQFRFVASLPAAALAALYQDEAGGRLDFAALVRRVVLALVLCRDELTVPDAATIEAFGERVFTDGALDTDVVRPLWATLDAHLDAALIDARERRPIRAAFEAELEALRRASGDGERLLLRFREDLVADDTGRGRKEALCDVRRHGHTPREPEAF